MFYFYQIRNSGVFPHYKKKKKSVLYYKAMILLQQPEFLVQAVSICKQVKCHYNYSGS